MGYCFHFSGLYPDQCVGLFKFHIWIVWSTLYYVSLFVVRVPYSAVLYELKLTEHWKCISQHWNWFNKAWQNRENWRKLKYNWAIAETQILLKIQCRCNSSAKGSSEKETEKERNWLGLLWPQSLLTMGHLTTDFWPQVTFDRGTFDRNRHFTAGHLTAVTLDRETFDCRTFDQSDIWPHIFDRGTFDRKWHLTVGFLTSNQYLKNLTICDIWPQDIWPQVTFDHGTFDHKWHLTAGFLTGNQDLKNLSCLTVGHLTAVTFDRAILDLQSKLEKLDRGNFDRQWHLTAGYLTAVTFGPAT